MKPQSPIRSLILAPVTLACALTVPTSGFAQGRKLQAPPVMAQPNQPNLPRSMKIRVEEDLVTAEFQNIPIQTALEEFAARSGVVFEVPLQDNDPISLSLFRVPLAEAVQRLVGQGNSILYYERTDAGSSRIHFVRVLKRSPKAAQASLRYIGTGAITKSGEDTIDSPDHAVKVLAEGKSADVRQKAVEVLVASKSELAVPALTAATRDAAPEVKAAAVEGLASLGARSALPQIIKCLKDSHPGVRRSAIDALALLGDAENLKDLRPMGHDQDASVAAAAEIAIKQLSMRRP